MWIDRAARRAQRLVSTIAEETILAWVPHGRRDDVTLTVYNGERTFIPGGARFNAGLFDWERRAITSAIFPAHGRILLGGAGGGREMIALADLGYDVVAFEPAEVLVRGALTICTKSERCQIVRGEYADLVQAARGAPSPLAGIVQSRLDGVILGWGSLSHVFASDDRLDVLKAVRQIAPTAPVLLSYLRRSSNEVGRARTVLRRWFARLGCPYRAVPGDGFTPWAGFYFSMTCDELHALAEAAGYTVALSEVQPYAHALLTPK